MDKTNTIRQFGLLLEVPEATAYVFGGLGSLPQLVLQDNGQWDNFLPVYEPQFNKFFDSSGCTVWGWQNVMEIYLKRLVGVEYNFSERFNYIVAGIRPPGADPHKVAESIRNNGVIENALLPMTPEQDFLAFLRPNPMTKELLDKGLEFPYELKHEYVFQSPISKEERIKKMKEALRFSTLGISVTAWIERGGVYVDDGKPNTHWVACFGWNTKGFKIFDSYDQSIKTLSFDHNIQVCKRIYLEKNSRLPKISLIQRILNLMNSLLSLLKAESPIPTSNIVPVPVLTQPEPVTSKLGRFCKAIEAYEDYVLPGGKYRDGTVAPNGSRSYRNRNPGNVKFSPVGYAPIYGLVLKDKNNFAIFKDYETGWLYLKNFVKSKVKENPMMSILDFITKIYAPPSENNSLRYAQFLAKEMGTTVYEPMVSVIQ